MAFFKRKKNPFEHVLEVPKNLYLVLANRNLRIFIDYVQVTICKPVCVHNATFCGIITSHSPLTPEQLKLQVVPLSQMRGGGKASLEWHQNCARPSKTITPSLMTFWQELKIHLFHLAFEQYLPSIMPLKYCCNWTAFLDSPVPITQLLYFALFWFIFCYVSLQLIF